MSQKIQLNDHVKIDLEKLITGKLLVQANSGGGKSWLIRRLVEQAYGKVQIIILDPEGEFSTLREKFDFVLAGKDGDTPAEPKSAAMLAKRLLELKVSAIIDLYELAPQERKHFVRLFLDAMVNVPKQLYNPCLVVLDEAHMFAPEKGESEALGAVIDMASRGRKREQSLILATQRISKLHKDAAAECNNKLIGRSSLDIDRKRAADELGITDKNEILALRSLKPGEFFAFGSAISDEVIRVTVGGVETSIPKGGSSFKTTPPTPAIKKILSKLGDLPAEAKKEAQTISELKQELATARRHRCPKNIDTAEIQKAVEQVKRQEHAGLEAVIKTYGKAWDQVFSYAGKIMDIKKEQDYFAETLKKPEVKTPYKLPALPYNDEPVYIPARIDDTARRALVSDTEETSKVGIGEIKILTAIAQYLNGITRETVTVLTGYKRSSRDVYIQRLKQRGFIRQEADTLLVTDEGINYLGASFKPLPTGGELREYLMQSLPEGEKKILSILMDNYPGSLTREVITEMSGYKRSTRDVYLQRLRSRQLVENYGRGEVKATDKLFE